MSNDFVSPSGDASSHAPGGYGAPQQPYGQPYQAGPPPGYAPGGYGAPQGPPPAPKIKPSVGWIVSAWLVFVLSVIVGFGGFVGGIFSAVTDAAPTETFGSGQTVTVSLDPADNPAIYVATSGRTEFTCELQDGPAPARLQQPRGQQTVASTDGVAWELGLRVGVDKAGDYKLTCTTEGANARFGVGKEIDPGSVVGGAVALVAVPGAGFLLAVVVTIVVLVKRSGARKRQAAAAAAQWGQPSPYGR
ncbi:hypothetical protein [Streptosporangium sp. NPDC000396]|uniref:hypothetical protein n=1 Tax=Streptosporangium sp. NPDC000396 TaxID=3366185 RepID=UPI00368B919A